mmetsp:Transcript_10007/g.27374  ORF Transcript_10007/g.27374 Transcript_10007/m.27374 type:complete len:279 (+) Transcript_10007:1261-2097(+)
MDLLAHTRLCTLPFSFVSVLVLHYWLLFVVVIVVVFNVTVITATLQSNRCVCALDEHREHLPTSHSSTAENDVQTEIPLYITNLTNLEYLDLASATMRGELITEIGRLVKLKTLKLSRNELESSMPSEIGYLTDLLEFDARHNSLYHTLPTELGNLANVMHLLLGSNLLESPLPSTFSAFSNLRALDIGGNQFNGTLPALLGNLTTLVDLAVDTNEFTGMFPDMSRLVNTEKVKLEGNFMFGDLDGMFCSRGRGVLEILSADCTPAIRCTCCDGCPQR